MAPLTACEMCETLFAPFENGADETFCSYSCASGGGSCAPASAETLWACGDCCFEDNTEDEDLCAACLTPRPGLMNCPCCEQTFREDQTHFAPYCTRACMLEADDDESEDDESEDAETPVQTCHECSAPFNVETWRAEYSPYCSYGCAHVNLPAEDEEAETPLLSIRMPAQTAGKSVDSFSPSDFDDGDNSGLAAIAPASVQAVPVPLQRHYNDAERAATKTQAEACGIVYHPFVVESYVYLESLHGSFPEGIVLLDPFTNYIYQELNDAFERTAVFDPWSAEPIRFL